MKEGDKCRKCGGEITIKPSPFKLSKLKKPYFYNGYYFCEDCGAMYMNDKFKVINKNYDSRDSNLRLPL